MKEKHNNSFFDSIKIDASEIDKISKKEAFLKEIKGNEEILNKLSIDRLKRLEKYYDEIIQQNNEKIKKLKLTQNN